MGGRKERDGFSEQTASSDPAETKPPVHVFQPATLTEACASHFRTAQRIFQSDANLDSFFQSAAYDCSSPDEYAAGLVAYPGSIGFDSVDGYDIVNVLGVACYGFEERKAPVCVQGIELGIISGE